MVLMKVAIPQWQGRVSPVLDVAAHLVVAEVTDGRETARREISLVAADPLERAREVSREGPDVLICGALSWPLEMALSAAGVRVVSHVCGAVEAVLAAFLDGSLGRTAFEMPGCCNRRRRGRGGSGRGRGRMRKAEEN
jgi:predicted Fe-Mo cluster-binding NifX family protein